MSTSIFSKGMDICHIKYQLKFVRDTPLAQVYYIFLFTFKSFNYLPFKYKQIIQLEVDKYRGRPCESR